MCVLHQEERGGGDATITPSNDALKAFMAAPGGALSIPRLFVGRLLAHSDFCAFRLFSGFLTPPKKEDF